MAIFGGWAGKVLRVDLSSGRTWTEETINRYKEYLGGTGIGYKVIWDEVPADTHPFDPANKIIFAVGPLAGTGAPCNGRTAITTLWPTCWPKPLVASGHMGGQFAAELKYAGYDAIVVEGKADSPVWLSIVDQQVEILDARSLWGQGIRRATVEISQLLGPDAVVAAIGRAGEHLVPMSVVMNSYSHSAGGVGAVMGSKHLKAIGVRGTGRLRVAGPKEEWERVVKLHLSLLGANNQHVVPDSPQPWAEYYDPGSRWKAAPALNVKSILVNLDVKSLFSENPRISSIEVNGATVNLDYDLARGLNISQLAKAADTALPGKPLEALGRRFQVDACRCRDIKLCVGGIAGKVINLDLAPFTLEDLSEKPVSVGEATGIFLRSVLTETVTLKGLLTPVGEKIQSELRQFLGQDTESN